MTHADDRLTDGAGALVIIAASLVLWGLIGFAVVWVRSFF
jgi:hypothetical protein